MPQTDTFRCTHCGDRVRRTAHGTRHRNHCPRCLWSRHVDERPGDRAAACLGDMEPIAISVRGEEWILIHRCRACGTLRANRSAGDDDAAQLLAIAARPLAHPPFPLEKPGRLPRV
ncbi:MAG: RNHCP domain-containing protein [Candidatus Limnocylindria bacterium]